MSRTLPLVENLLVLGRNFHQAGRTRDAIDLFTRLAGFRALPAEVAEEIHSRLAELHEGHQNYRKARRHLVAALTQRPDQAEYHHRLALLIEIDPEASLTRAAYHHRQAIRCEPDMARYWAAYGAYLLNYDQQRRGLKALNRAFRLGQHDPELVGNIAQTLRQAGFRKRATRFVRLALFRSAGNRRFRDLWNRHQFDLLHDAQQSRRESVGRRATSRRVLPFVRIADVTPRTTLGGKTIRFDQAKEHGEPNLPLPKGLPHRPRNRRTNG